MADHHIATPKARVGDLAERIAALEETLEQSPGTLPAPGAPVKTRVGALEARLEALEEAAEGYEPPEGSQPLSTWLARPWKHRLENLEARLAALEAHVES